MKAHLIKVKAEQGIYIIGLHQQFKAYNSHIIDICDAKLRLCEPLSLLKLFFGGFLGYAQHALLARTSWTMVVASFESR